MIKALSQFLFGTKIQYAWDSTTLGALKTCPRYYQYAYIDGWTPKDESVHLKFGIEYHKSLEEYDAFRLSGSDHNHSLRGVVRSLLLRIRDWNPDTDTKSGKYKNPLTLVQLVIDYLDKYAEDPAQTIVRQDGRPATEVSFRFELEWGPRIQDDEGISLGVAGQVPQPYILSGHLDRVVDFNDQKLVMDHKTTTNTPGQYFMAQFNPNNQMTLYTLAGQIVLNAPIKGVIIAAAQILLEKPNHFERGFTFRTPDQLDEWLTDLRFWLNQAENYATVGYWPMNDTACDKFGGCRFRSACSKDPAVRERFLAADFVQLPEEDRWNPLRPR